jgi:hypothetical protein
MTIANLANERTRTALFDSSGRITAGSAFGVAVGDQIGMARTKLVEGGWWSYYETSPSCLSLRTEDGQTTDVYVDDSWRRGTLCVVHRDSVVTSLEWAFSRFTPEL